MRDEPYFSPGDKVMRVTPRPVPGSIPCKFGSPRMGVVYCVEDFLEGPMFNAVMLVGFGGWGRDPQGNPVGWASIHFRKVDEIRLCVAAANYVAAPVAPTPIQVTP